MRPRHPRRGRQPNRQARKRRTQKTGGADDSIPPSSRRRSYTGGKKRQCGKDRWTAPIQLACHAPKINSNASPGRKQATLPRRAESGAARAPSYCKWPQPRIGGRPAPRKSDSAVRGTETDRNERGAGNRSTRRSSQSSAHHEPIHNTHDVSWDTISSADTPLFFSESYTGDTVRPIWCPLRRRNQTRSTYTTTNSGHRRRSGGPLDNDRETTTAGRVTLWCPAESLG